MSWSGRIATLGGVRPFSLSSLFSTASNGIHVVADQGVNTASQWSDVSGFGNHLVQPTSGNQLALATGLNGRACYRQLVNLDQHWNLPSGFTVDRQAHSWWMICRVRSVPQGANPRAFVNFGAATTDCTYQFGKASATDTPVMRAFGTATQYSSIIGRSDLIVVTGRANASGVKLTCNEKSDTLSAFTAGTVTGGLVGQRQDGAAVLSGEMYEFGVVDYYLSDDQIALIRAYAQQRFRTWPTYGLFVIQGDSLTEGQQAVSNISWPRLLDDEIGGTWKQISRAKAAQTAATAASVAADDALLYDSAFTKKIALFFQGTNDLAAGTTAATVLGYIQTWTSAMKGAGFKTIVCTITSRGGGAWDATKETQRQSLNTSIRALSNTYADSIVDLDAIPQLQTPTDGTYFDPDQVHYMDPAFPLIKSAVKTALLAL